jgi:rubrerythrin
MSFEPHGSLPLAESPAQRDRAFKGARGVVAMQEKSTGSDDDMISREMDRVLIGLAKIETGLSRVYEKLSGKPYFRQQVKRFWSELANEEMAHAQVFNKLRERVISDDSFEVHIGQDLDYLKGFVNKAKELVKKVETDISEAEAYNLCAEIEGELDEASFIDRIQIQDDMLSRKLSRVKADTRKHKMVLINYARGIK